MALSTWFFLCYHECASHQTWQDPLAPAFEHSDALSIGFRGGPATPSPKQCVKNWTFHLASATFFRVVRLAQTLRHPCMCSHIRSACSIGFRGNICNPQNPFHLASATVVHLASAAQMGGGTSRTSRMDVAHRGRPVVPHMVFLSTRQSFLGACKQQQRELALKALINSTPSPRVIKE